MTHASAPVGAPMPRALGHLALHTRPGENPLAAQLFELLGCKVSNLGPYPNGTEFHVIEINSAEPGSPDNVVFLSTMTEEQQALERLLSERLDSAADAVKDFALKKAQIPEFFFHFGIHFSSLEELEDAADRIAQERASRSAVGTRIQGLQRLKAQSGKDAAIDARMAASRVFAAAEQEAYGPGAVQIHIQTDLFASGLSLFGSVIELDYVFPGTRSAFR